MPITRTATTSPQRRGDSQRAQRKPKSKGFNPFTSLRTLRTSASLRFKLLQLFFLAAATNVEAQAPVLVITHATLIDGIAAEPVRDASVVIRDGKIERIATGDIAAPAGATVLDLRGKWLLPGFIDAHAHLVNFADARTALMSGATTVRSLGVDHFADVGIRALNRAGVADAPDVIASGYHVRPRPSDALYLDLPALADMMPRGVNGAESIRRMVRALIERPAGGVDVIKIMATERAGLPDTDPRKRVYSEEELSAAVEEARRLGKTVAAHAHGDEGAAAAVRAGVKTIEHGTYLSDATLTLMKARGTCFDPTIATVIDLMDVGGDYDHPGLAMRGRAMLPRVRDATVRARRMGVAVIAGTDTRYAPTGTRRMQDEIAELVGIGMSPMEAIKSGTSVSAQCLGVDQRTGAVKVGLEADLVVVDRDPLADIGALRDVVLVVNNGRVAVNRLNN
jgi:imidazolonepropionase-like amidohydrolase